MRREFTEPLPPQNRALPPALRPAPPTRAGIPAGRPDPPVPACLLRLRLTGLPASCLPADFFRAPFAGPCLHAPDTEKVRNEMLVTDFP